ncbi:MAG: MoxR family ATPase [Lachnospiraceae bacterium]|nr:MoxR family ATPase [Lachnospiraceae bacterium]MBR4543681.1 MoxR family ATPase [Lachnospiraceae bacterium]
MATVSDQIIDEVKKVIHGKDEVIKLTLCAILAGGHVLLEDIPGVGKTTLAVAFSKALSLAYRRVQFTPDVMPSDLLGFNLYDKNAGEFRFQPGSIYTNLFLADEINRTSPKTQSALLEVMEERHATVEGVTRYMPEPFFVLATDNPFGSSGTQKLPESQLDRFMICLTMGYPDFENALAVLKGDSSVTLNHVNAVADTEKILSMQAEVKEVFVSDVIYEYIVKLTETTRDPMYFALGLSPRGSIAVLKMAKAYAYVQGRNYVIPEDVHDIWYAVAGHRVRLGGQAKASGISTEEALKRVLGQVEVPRIS